MKYKKEEPSEVIEKEEKIEITISKKLCNSCKTELPKITDKGICPVCGRRN